MNGNAANFNILIKIDRSDEQVVDTMGPYITLLPS